MICTVPGVLPWGGHPQGAPLPIVFSRRFSLGRAPTRGAPTNCLLSAFCAGEGTHKGPPTNCLLSAFFPGEGAHKGRPYQLSSLGVLRWGGHPQGAPLPIVFSRRYALGRAPTRGAPTDCLLSALCPGEGAHKGCPYQFVFSRRFALGRAPTRGAPTRFRQPHEVFSYLMQLPCGFDRIPLRYVYWWRQFNRFLLRCAFRPDARRTMGEDR